MLFFYTKNEQTKEVVGELAIFFVNNLIFLLVYKNLNLVLLT